MSDANNFEERLSIAREAFAALVAADAYIARAPALPVVTEQKGDIAMMINQALAKLGLCIVVVAADGDSLQRSGDSISMRVRFAAQISEKVLLNQAAAKAANVAYRPALNVAMRVVKAVDRKANGLDTGRHQPGLNEFLVDDDRAFELVKTPNDVVYEVSAYSHIEL